MKNNKGDIMNNLKKLGLSALAGSLVAVSAQAGEMAVSGSANVVLKSGNQPASALNQTGKTIGTDKDVAFTGTGELDNGFTFTFNTTLNDAYDVSSSFTSLTMGSLGTLTAGTDYGGNGGKYDEEVPQAYEQTSDAQQNSANLIGNQMDNNAITYNSPTFEYAGASMRIDAGYSFMANGEGAGDGAQSTYSSTKGAGYELGTTIKYEGVTLGIYGTERENTTPIVAANGDAQRDAFEGAWYATYAYGPVTVGYSETYLDNAISTVALTSAAAAKVVNDRDQGGIFTSESMSIAFNVNDNLSISYTDTDDTYDDQSNVKGGTEIEDVTQSSKAIQVAYSMGAMSIKAYNMETKNPTYDNDQDKESVTEIALGLAF